MKTYLVEYKDHSYIMRAESKLQASCVIEYVLYCHIPLKCVKRLPKDNTIYKVKGN